MLHQFHASDSEGDDPGDLEFGNVHLSQSFSQMHQQQPRSGAPQEHSPASAGGQRPASLAISLPSESDGVAAQATNGDPATRYSQPSAGSRAAARAQGGAAVQQPHSTQPDHAQRSKSGAADRLLSDTHYVRRNAATPPPLPAPPPWLRERLGGSSLTELYLQNGRPAHAGHISLAPPLHAGSQPPATASHTRMQPKARRAVALGDMHMNGATAAAPPGLPLAGPDSTIRGEPGTAIKSQTGQGQDTGGGSMHGPTGSAPPAPTPLHLELQRFAAQACDQAHAVTLTSEAQWLGSRHTSSAQA